MALSIRHLIMFFFGVLACLPMLGQSSSVSPLALKFTAYAVKPPSDEISYLPRPESTGKSIRFYTSAKSAVQEYRGPNPITFFQEKPSLDPTQSPVRTVLARVTIPEGMVEPLFLFFPNPEFGKNTAALPYMVYVFDDGADSLPAGHLALINASGMEFVGQFNTEVVTVPRGLNPPVKIGRSARVELRTLVRGKYYQSYLSTHPFGPNERALMLLLPPYHSGSIEAQVRILRSELEPNE